MSEARIATPSKWVTVPEKWVDLWSWASTDHERRRHSMDIAPDVILGIITQLACAEDAKRRMAEALTECEEYFDSRADADHNGSRFVPNAEMRMLNTVRSAMYDGAKEVA